ncbi:MAG: GNAT family N-acetyltransferase [Thermoflexales bacterium]|nr:GNAT family N-acetyltransferase [Thermoflexales bacterium]
MHVQVFDTPRAFEELRDEWNRTLAASAADTLFLTREWQQVWWQVLGDGEMRVLALREGSDLVGIAPLFFSENALGAVEVALIGCKEVSDYLDFIFVRGYEARCFEAVVSFLKSEACPRWDTIGLCNIVEGSLTLSVFCEMLAAEGWRPHVAFEDVCPVVELPDTFDAYLGMLDGKERRELQRKLRRASEDTRIVFAERADTLHEDVEDFLRLMAASTPQKAAFLTPRMRRFFHAAARVMFECRQLQLAFLEVEGVRAAAYMNFLYRDAVLVYNSGLEPERYAYLSPGQVLIARLIEKAIAERRRVFDFLQGDEEYKYKLGGKDVRLYTLSARRAQAAH